MNAHKHRIAQHLREVLEPYGLTLAVTTTQDGRRTIGRVYRSDRHKGRPERAIVEFDTWNRHTVCDVMRQVDPTTDAIERTQIDPWSYHPRNRRPPMRIYATLHDGQDADGTIVSVGATAEKCKRAYIDTMRQIGETIDYGKAVYEIQVDGLAIEQVDAWTPYRMIREVPAIEIGFVL